jgi:cation diffusion facilitator family transporter
LSEGVKARLGKIRQTTTSSDDMSQSTAHAAEKQDVARKTTVGSIAVNSVLIAAQTVAGVFAHSQALIADGIHSLAALVSDFVVLLANRHSTAAPDDDHNYGHSRYETIASLFLGALLIIVGVGMLWRAGERIPIFKTSLRFTQLH